jgi:hypothetical protein
MCAKLKVTVCSDRDYEELIAEIYHDEKFVALISQDEGRDKLYVEFPKPNNIEEMVAGRVGLEWFQDALEKAKLELIG